MSATTVLKKGAPSRSYPSRQRKLGPAPFASFEDLSDELESPAGDCGGGTYASSSSSGAVEVLPGIQEDPCHDEEMVKSHKTVTATSSGSTVTFAASQPTSGLQTPSTPRIDISCASSSTPPSEESEESDKELFQGGLGYAFHEEGAEELRSSTEELDLGEVLELDSEEEKRQKKREKEAYDDIYRRASTPANIFYRRKSSNTTGNDQGDDDLHRKPSAHTLFLDGLLSRPAARHHSFGSSDCGRPGARSSQSAHSSGSLRGRSRSPSPHKMMLETSFCGCKPIPTKSMEVEDNIPHRSQSSPPSIKKEEQETVLAPTKVIKEPHYSAENNQRSLSIKSLTAPNSRRSPEPPSSPTPSSSGGNSRRPSYGRRSVSPFKMVYETSFCGSKPIPTKSMEVPDSPPNKAADDDLDLSSFLLSRTTAQVHTSRPLSPSSPKSSDHWRPITPKSEADLSPLPLGERAAGVSEESSPSISTSTAKYVSTPNPAQNLKLQTSNIFKWPETTVEKKSIDEITTEFRFSEPPSSECPSEDAGIGVGVPLESVEEAKFLHAEFDTEAEVDADDYEDGDLPYVPTSLPQEKPQELVFPSKERRSSEGLTPLQRPKVVRPPNPASLNDYIAYASGGGIGDKMRINLPREDSLGASSSITGGPVLPLVGGIEGSIKNSPIKKKGSIGATNWADFAEMGLRSPRELRRKLREENGEDE